MGKIDLTGYEGQCIGIVEGKVVVSDKDIKKVIAVLNGKYSDKEVLLSSVPNKDMIFVL